MKGAHLQGDQKERAAQGITKIKARYQLLDVLREDRYGAVYLYQQKSSGCPLIIKKKLSNSSGFETSNKLAKIHHSNILTTLGTAKNERLFILVQEYLSGGTLQDKLAFELDWNETLRIGKEICEGMDFAHKHQIVHGHLRPTNILFTDAGQVKLTDFGLQDDLSDIKNAHFYSLEDESQGIAADIYAVGVILYQLFTGSLPRQEQANRRSSRKTFLELPGDIQELITTMLSTIPERRHKDSFQRCILMFTEHLEVNGSSSPESEAAEEAATEAAKEFMEEVEEAAEDTGTGKEVTAITLPKDSAETQEPVFELVHPQQKIPVYKTRLFKVFGVLVLLFSQYLLFFDGNQKISEAYSQVAATFQDFLGE